MARPGTKAAKARDPKIATHWPVSQYPYLIQKPYADSIYKGSWKEATKWMIADVRKLAKQFERLDSEVVASCDQIVQAIVQLPVDGGDIDMIAVPYNDMRYRARLVCRKEIS